MTLCLKPESPPRAIPKLWYVNWLDNYYDLTVQPICPSAGERSFVTTRIESFLESFLIKVRVELTRGTTGELHDGNDLTYSSVASLWHGRAHAKTILVQRSGQLPTVSLR